MPGQMNSIRRPVGNGVNLKLLNEINRILDTSSALRDSEYMRTPAGMREPQLRRTLDPGTVIRDGEYMRTPAGMREAQQILEGGTGSPLPLREQQGLLRQLNDIQLLRRGGPR